MIVLFLCLAGIQGHSFANTNTSGSAAQENTATIDRTRDNIPQWEDLGMENLLVVGSQPTVTAPTPMRLSHDNGSPLGRAAATQNRMRHSVVERDALPHRAQPDYIYHLLCLRL